MTFRKPLDLMQKWQVSQYWVRQQPSLSRASFFVLMRLLDRQNTKTGRCDPSAIGLLEETGFSERSVRSAFKELEERGVIKRNRVTRRSRNQFLIYSLQELGQNQQTAVSNGRSAQRPDLQPIAAPPAIHCRPNLQRAAPESINETIKEKKSAESLSASGKNPASLTGHQTNSGINYGEFERRVVKVFEREGFGYEGLMMLSADELESVFERFSDNHLTFGDAIGELLDSFRVACGQH